MSCEKLRAIFRDNVVATMAQWVPAGAPHFEQTLQFALGRLREGEELSEFFSRRLSTRVVKVLDLGAGNGGVSIALANAAFDVTAMDIVPNPDLLALRRQTGLPVRQIIGNGHCVPFGAGTFDVVVCLDTIEHVPHPERLGPEIMRVLRPGGLCMITTPARLRHLFGREPHFGIPALLLLPARAQRWVAHLLREGIDYDVHQVFWHVRRVARLFPNTKDVEVLWNRPFPFQNRFGNWWWFRFRNLLWDRIILTKHG
jgi:2-polyprenyl-3-methyl-5-hydroxy-6-metoxy-1,4-benzoquinol methylase